LRDETKRKRRASKRKVKRERRRRRERDRRHSSQDERHCEDKERERKRERSNAKPTRRRRNHFLLNAANDERSTDSDLLLDPPNPFFFGDVSPNSTPPLFPACIVLFPAPPSVARRVELVPVLESRPSEEEEGLSPASEPKDPARRD